MVKGCYRRVSVGGRNGLEGSSSQKNRPLVSYMVKHSCALYSLFLWFQYMKHVLVPNLTKAAEVWLNPSASC